MSSEERIRVRYSSVVNYGSQIYRLLIAVGFSIVVIRKLPIEEYGLWTTAIALYGSLWSISSMWSFWAPRYYARGWRSAVGVSLALNALFAVVVAAAVAIVGLGYQEGLGWGLYVFLAIAAMLVPVDILYTFSRAVLPVAKPETLGYMTFVFETLRLPLAYMLIVVVRWGILGLIIALGLSELSAAAYGLWAAYRLGIPLRPLFDRILISRWFKFGGIPAIQSVAGLVHGLDRPSLTAISNSTGPSAFLGVASLPRRFMTQGALSAAWSVYAKLLREPSPRAMEDVMKILLLLNVWATGIFLAFSKPILSLLNPVYVGGWFLLDFMAVESLLFSLWNIMRIAAIGAERADVEGSSVYGTVLSRIPMAFAIRNVISIATATVIVVFLRGWTSDSVILSSPYAILWMISAIPLLVHAGAEAKRILNFKLPVREAVVFVSGAVLMYVYSMLTGAQLIIVSRFWSGAPPLIAHVLAASAIYVAISLALSPWFRSFVRAGTSLLSKP